MEKKRKRITILDVARVSGVTDGTVSRALAGDKRVSPKTRDKILKIAEKLNYRPHLFARYLRTNVTKHLGIFWQGGSWLFYNHYYGSLLSGLAESAEKDGNHLVFYLPEIQSLGEVNSYNVPIQMTGFNELLDGRVDGAVVLGFRTIPEEQLAILRRSGMPVVLMSQQKEVPGFFQLLAGTYERTRLAAEKLLDMGHRRIGYMGFFEESLHEEMVQNAMEDAFRKRRLKLGKGWRECSEKWNIWDVTLIERQLNKLLENKCTGIICVSADQAMLAVEILKRKGIEVPRDLSLAAYGPLSFVAQFQRSTLCLIEADLFKAGSQVYELYKEAQQGKKCRSISIEWKWLGQGNSDTPTK